MFISNLQENPRLFFAVIISVIVSITLHELAHGFAAISRGDRTPVETGHITANPLVHMGPFSLIMLALAGIAWGSMPIDPTRMRGKYAEAFVAFAGPFTNLILAVVATAALGLWLEYGSLNTDNNLVKNGIFLLEIFALLNFALMVFNLLPVPPLDGSRILANFVPPYHKLLTGEFASGVVFAMFILVFMKGGTLIFGAARWLMNQQLNGMERLLP